MAGCGPTDGGLQRRGPAVWGGEPGVRQPEAHAVALRGRAVTCRGARHRGRHPQVHPGHARTAPVT
eukprot:3368724-Rhodomonas_salina.2